MKTKKAKSLPPPKTPECDRLLAVHAQSQRIGDFIDWLHDTKHVVFCSRHEHTDDCHGWRGGAERLVCDYDDGEPVPINANPEKLLAEYFKIDMNKVDDERRALLDYQRKLNAKTTD